MIAPNITQSATTIAGPYGTTYGPGFGFINVNTADTPRYQNAQVHLDVGDTYWGNGSQFNGYERAYGGGTNYGFSIYHNTRFGSAYHDGNGTDIPAEYSSQDFFGQGGVNITDTAKLEFRFLRQDINHTQIPGQFYQLNHSGSNGFNFRLTNESPNNVFDRSVTEAWYNDTYFSGATNAGETYFNEVNRVQSAACQLLPCRQRHIPIEHLRLSGDVRRSLHGRARQR